MTAETEPKSRHHYVRQDENDRLTRVAASEDEEMILVSKSAVDGADWTDVQAFDIEQIRFLSEAFEKILDDVE